MSLFDKLGQGISNALSDRDFKDRMILGLSGLTMNPNQAAIQYAQGNIQQRRQDDLLNRQSNATIDFLQKSGIDPELLAQAKGNPAILKALLQRVTAKPSSASTRSYAPQTDPITGQTFITTFDPVTQETKRVNVEGATQQTAQQKADLETQQRVKQADMLKAQDAAQAAMQQASDIQSKLPIYESIIRDIDQGADTGIIMSKLPAFNEATASLRSAANQLGITVINSATFGALSEAELNLALSTEIPQNLSGQALKQYLIKKYQAQASLSNEIRRKARELSGSGMTYSQYIQQNTMQDIPTTLPNVTINLDDDAGVEKIR